MKRLILCLPCIICLFACGKENGFWQWKIDQENIMENVDFPHEGSLRLITSKEDTMQATLEFSYKNPAAGQLSDGEVCEAFVYFDFVGMPYQMKDNNSSIRLYANELPGLVRYSVMESGTDLYVINGIMGSFSFDTTLEFQTTLSRTPLIRNSKRVRPVFIIKKWWKTWRLCCNNTMTGHHPNYLDISILL